MKRWKLVAAAMSVSIVMAGMTVCAEEPENVQAVAAEVQNTETEIQTEAVAEKGTEEVAEPESAQTAVTEETEAVAESGKNAKATKEVKKVKSLEVARNADKSEVWGTVKSDSLNMKGTRILVKYSDDTEAQLICGADENWYLYDDGYESYNIDVETEYVGDSDENGTCANGEQNVKVSYLGAEVEVPFQITGISRVDLVSAPNSVEYYAGYDSSLSYSGLKIKTLLSDGRTVNMSYKSYYEDEDENEYYDVWLKDNGSVVTECSPYIDDDEIWGSNGMNAGQHTVSVEVGSKSTSFNIQVKQVKSISINQLPKYTELYGEDNRSYSLDRMKLNVTFSDGTSKILEYDDEDWRDPQGNIQNVNITTEYRGNYRVVSENEKYYAYGTWRVEVKLAGATTSYNLVVKPYDVKQEGNITLGQLHQCVLKEHQVSKFNFTPTVTGIYGLRYMGTRSNYSASLKQGTLYCNSTGTGYLLEAGKTYTLEIRGDDVYRLDNVLIFKIMKSDEFALNPLKAPANAAVNFDKESNSKYYTFTPEVSGTYSFYSDGAKNDFDPEVTMYVGDLSNYVTDSDDNSYVGHGYNFGLKTYLQKGQNYIFEVSVRSGEEGTLKINLKQETENHAHQWYESYHTESNCAQHGKKVQSCSTCGIMNVEALPLKAHAYGAYALTRKATALTQGVQTRTCSVCGDQDAVYTAKLPATIKLNAKSIVLKTGQSTTAVKVSGLAEGDAVASWKSSKPSVVKVNNKGKITAGKKTGSAVLTVKLKSGKKVTVKVKVQKKAVTTKKIKVNKKNVTLKKNKSYTIKATLNPITSSDKVKFTSSNKKVATVNAKGVVKAKKAGTAKITVKAGKKKAVVTVKVK